MVDGLGLVVPAFLLNFLMGEVKESRLEKPHECPQIVISSQKQIENPRFSVAKGGIGDKIEDFYDEKIGLVKTGVKHRILFNNEKKCGFARYKTIHSARHVGSYAFVDRFSVAFWHLNKPEDIDAAYEILYQAIRQDLKFPRSVELIIPETDSLTKDWCSRRGFKKLKKYDDKPYKSYLMSFRTPDLSDQTESD